MRYIKQIFIFFTISIVFAAFTVKKYAPNDLTQLVVTIPDLDKADLKDKLELEFVNINGILLCEVSLMTKTLMIQYDDKKVSYEKIHSIFNKWGCVPERFTYNRLY